MRIKFRTIRLALGVVIMVLSIQPTAKADSFAFSFQGPTDRGSGIFFTSPLLTSPECPPVNGGCYAITSLTGQFDGYNITTILPLGDYWGAVTPSLKLLTIT